MGALAGAAIMGRPGFGAGRTSLDAFRGFDILSMVFVNYIAGMKAIPFILRHASAEMDTFMLTDSVLRLLGGVLHINLWQVVWPFAETGGRAGLKL